MNQLPKPYQQFRTNYPEIFSAYEDLGEAISKAGPLDKKVCELIKLGMAAANGSESAVHSHTHRALELGADSEEIEHTLLLGINTLGFSTSMAALGWAKHAVSTHVK